MNLSFEINVALVTGAAAGMGLATAKAFAEAGAAVALANFREDMVRAEAEKLAAAGHKAIGVRVHSKLEILNPLAAGSLFERRSSV